ncbi:MAG: tRNA pseudouridine(38-40) synthase TruA [Balneolaceae bacterium]
MGRFKLTIEYDGTDFLGWQRQPEGRTVQGELERALQTWCRATVGVVGQGRTDRGVHARGQVAHVDLPEEADPKRLIPAMNGLLPKDMAILEALPVPPGFHARFDALSRRYSYRISLRPAPLIRNRSWFPGQRPNRILLDQCAAFVAGEHDFSLFARLDAGDERSTVCRITRSEWLDYGEQLHYTIEGDRFLRHMVRRLVGSMVRVAMEECSRDEFEQLLSVSAEVTRKGYSAPPQGLLLEEVTYGA